MKMAVAYVMLESHRQKLGRHWVKGGLCHIGACGMREKGAATEEYRRQKGWDLVTDLMKGMKWK